MTFAVNLATVGSNATATGTLLTAGTAVALHQAQALTLRAFHLMQSVLLVFLMWFQLTAQQAQLFKLELAVVL